MSELEKILRESVGKVVSVHYLVPDFGEHTATGELISVTNEIITVMAVMKHHINRKTTILIGVDIKE